MRRHSFVCVLTLVVISLFLISVLYVTYAKASEGDLRERYYSDKRASFPPDCERDPNKKYEYKI